MAQSISTLLVHLVFSTKDRLPLLLPDVEARLYTYFKTLSDDLKSPIIILGGTTDHIHILVNLSKEITLSDYVSKLKSNSSRWIKKINPELLEFSWQRGYGAFSIGQSAKKQIIDYISNQKEHHKKITFKDEFVAFLNKYELDYKEEYLWND